MIRCVMFTEEEGILELAGVKDTEVLWDAGFNLDDWDWGICCEQRLGEYRISEEGERYFVPVETATWLIDRMEMYCAGFSEAEYNGRWYYTVHHS